MKKTIIYVVLIAIISGCIDTQENRVLKGNDNSTITLYPNGQLVIHFASSDMSYSGVYVKQGDDLVLTYSGLGLSATLTPKGNGYVDQDGDVWN